ncbi:MAG: response regulator [Anaerolineales bacterium]|nr:response regulator [Anaerolineales bacterium]MCW5838528.1 response regulator [Anaerolineales bacterium]
MKNKLRVLVVDDELAVRRFLRASLSAGGFDILEAATGEQALLSAVQDRPDIILLDLGLPDVDGIEVTRRLREWSQIPILIISVRDREADKVRALDEGADDYVTKPFGLGELLARMRAALRHRRPMEEQQRFVASELEIDFTKRIVKLADQQLQLTPIEYSLLRELATHVGRVLTHRHLLRAVWGVAYERETHLLRVHMSNLRQKIEKNSAQPQYIVTEPGVGYRFKENV